MDPYSCCGLFNRKTSLDEETLENINGGANVDTTETHLLEDNALTGAIQENNNTDTSLPDRYYKMDYQSKGLLIIFNHYEFDHKTRQLQRNATNLDVERIVETFKTIGFEFQCFNDLTLAQIQTHIKNFSKTDYYHRERSCLAIFVLTHGEYSGGRSLLWAKDKPYDPSVELWGHFTADKCPAFAGKPKLIFLQACQGKKVDHGVMIPLNKTEFDGHFLITIPSYADLLIAYATYKEHVAYRNRSNGSYWVNCLCQELLQHYETKNILDILTSVHGLMAAFTSSNKTDSSKDGLKQMPYFQSTLTKYLIFGGN